MTLATSVTVADLEMHADNLDPKRAAAIYQEHGALVVRRLTRKFVQAVRADIELAARGALSLYEQAKRCPEGWYTPDGMLWIPAPKNFSRDKQIMVLGCRYNASAAPRPVFIHRWRRADDYVVINATTTDNRALNEMRVADAKKENQMGYMVRGSRQFDAGRVTQ